MQGSSTAQANPHRGFSHVGQEKLSRVKDCETGVPESTVVYDIKVTLLLSCALPLDAKLQLCTCAAMSPLMNEIVYLPVLNNGTLQDSFDQGTVHDDLYPN
jgi:hypothetical protein